MQAKTKLLKHLILTKYNLNLYNDPNIPHAKPQKLTPEDWMWHRYWLFKKFCVPSILRQTNQNFEWLIAIDSKTSKQQYRHIEAILPDNAKIISLSKLSKISEAIKAKSENTKYILTTKLDNDDMLRENAIECIQTLTRHIIRRKQPKSQCIDVPNGYTIKEDLTEFRKCELRNTKKSKRTSFVSYLTGGSSSINALRWGPLCKIPPEQINFIHKRLWARIIHMANLSNRLIGSRCGIPSGFGIKIELPAGFPGV